MKHLSLSPSRCGRVFCPQSFTPGLIFHLITDALRVLGRSLLHEPAGQRNADASMAAQTTRLALAGAPGTARARPATQPWLMYAEGVEEGKKKCVTPPQKVPLRCPDFYTGRMCNEEALAAQLNENQRASVALWESTG